MIMVLRIMIIYFTSKFVSFSDSYDEMTNDHGSANHYYIL